MVNGVGMVVFVVVLVVGGSGSGGFSVSLYSELLVYVNFSNFNLGVLSSGGGVFFYGVVGLVFFV